MHFYWVNRDKESFEWFADLLSELEQNNVGNFLEINVYLTERVKKKLWMRVFCFTKSLLGFKRGRYQEIDESGDNRK